MTANDGFRLYWTIECVIIQFCLNFQGNKNIISIVQFYLYLRLMEFYYLVNYFGRKTDVTNVY